MLHTTPAKVLLATTLQPLVVQLSGSLAHGAKLIAQFLAHEPTPQKMATFAQELSTLLREVGRRIVAWVLNHVEPESNDDTPSRLQFEGQYYRRRGKHRSMVSTLFGTVEVQRRLYEPLDRERRALHPLERRVGGGGGVRHPAPAGPGGRVAAHATQQRLTARIAEWAH